MLFLCDRKRCEAVELRLVVVKALGSLRNKAKIRPCV